jgi:hypothetical protein
MTDVEDDSVAERPNSERGDDEENALPQSIIQKRVPLHSYVFLPLIH